MSTPQNEAETDESSGVTTLRPVPAKPARLVDLAESDSTSYFSASDLLERGKALAALASEPAPPPTAGEALEPEIAPRRPSWPTQFRQASLPRKLTALLLPLLCILLLVKPRLEKREQPTTSEPSPRAAAPIVPPQPKHAPPAPISDVETPILPRGVTVAHAAADSVATGDFSRAARLYRELSRREPTNQAYREAARILSERTPARAP